MSDEDLDLEGLTEEEQETFRETLNALYDAAERDGVSSVMTLDGKLYAFSRQFVEELLKHMDETDNDMQTLFVQSPESEIEEEKGQMN